MASTKDIVIIGGSYAGSSVAHHLMRHTIPVLPKSANVRVVLVSASDETMCRPACPRAMISEDEFDQSKLFVSITASFKQYSQESFAFVHGRATKVDHTARTVSVKARDGSEQTLPYFSLVVATGSNTNSPLYGMNHDSEQLKADWDAFRLALPKAERIVIVGGGPTGSETAGELAEYLNGKPGWFSSPSSAQKTNITLITSSDQLLPILRPSLASKAESLLQKLGVTVIKSKRVTSVSPPDAGTSSNLLSAATVELSDGTSLEADLYIPATGVTPNTSFIDPSLLVRGGRVATNDRTLRVDAAGPRVYCVGDAGSYARDAVHLILSAVPVAAANIKRDLLLELDPSKAASEDRLFAEDKRETQLVPIGKGSGVGAALGWALPSFVVWGVKGRDYFLSHTPSLWDGRHWAKEG